MNSLLPFLLCAAIGYVFLRVILSLLVRGARRLLGGEDTFATLKTPLHALIIASALWISAQTFLPPSLLSTLDLPIETLLHATLLWLSVRLLTQAAFLLRAHSRTVPASLRVLRSLVNKILYLLSALIYLHLRHEFALSDLVITTAILAIVFSVAFQTPLANFYSGLSLSLADTFAPGDYISVGPHKGVVIESDWQRIRLLTPGDNHLTLPMRRLSEMPIVNYTRPNDLNRVIVPLPVNPRLSPDQAHHILLHTVTSIEGVLATPPPFVHLAEIRPDSRIYHVTFTFRNYANRDYLSDRLRSLAWYRLRRAGLQQPFGGPEDPATHSPALLRRRQTEEIRSITTFLSTLDLFAPLSPANLRTLATQATLQLYGQGETLFRQGEPGDSLLIIRTGQLAVLIRPPSAPRDTPEKQVALLSPPSIVGEISLLTGEPRGATLHAHTESEVLSIAKPAFQQILARDPRIAETLTDIMLRRQSANTRRSAEDGDPDTDTTKRENLLARIRLFFEL